MSFFTDFVLAGTKEAKKVLATPNPTDTWPGFSWKSVTALDVAEIYALLRGAKADPVALHDEFKFLATGDGMVQRVPEPLIELLAGVDDDVLPKTAKRVRKLDPFKSWSTEDLEALMKDLVTWSRRAKDEKKPMLMCMAGF